MSNFNGFPADLPQFFHALVNNNNREWFEANKQHYIVKRWPRCNSGWCALIHHQNSVNCSARGLAS